MSLLATNKPPEARFGRNAFAVLGKRKALDEVHVNERPLKKQPTTGLKRQVPPQFTQMQLAVGQTVQKKCDVCSMSYVISSAEDRRLHDNFHSQYTDGYDVGRSFLCNNDAGRTIAVGTDHICIVDCFDKPHRKRRAQAALDLVQRDLGAVEISADKLWNAKHLSTDQEARMQPAYRAYMFIRLNRCIGYLLVHDIERAQKVVKPVTSAPITTAASSPDGATSALSALRARQQAAKEEEQYCLAQAISLSKKAYPARLGVSRIWTALSHRQAGVATRLLDASLHHQHNLDKASSCSEPSGGKPDNGPRRPDSTPTRPRYEKHDVAFSQPTAAGARLARRWFGKNFDWKVYSDVD